MTQSSEKPAAPCRLALKVQTTCPHCCRPMSIKNLKYQHKCKRTWDVAQRAEEEEKKAKAHFCARVQPGENEDKKAGAQNAAQLKYAALLAQIY